MIQVASSPHAARLFQPLPRSDVKATGAPNAMQFIECHKMGRHTPAAFKYSLCTRTVDNQRLFIQIKFLTTLQNSGCVSSSSSSSLSEDLCTLSFSVSGPSRARSEGSTPPKGWSTPYSRGLHAPRASPVPIPCRSPPPASCSTLSDLSA